MTRALEDKGEIQILCPNLTTYRSQRIKDDMACSRTCPSHLTPDILERKGIDIYHKKPRDKRM